MFESYEAGVRCWVPDDKEGWIGAEVTSKQAQGDKFTLGLKLENGQELTKTYSSERDAPPLRNPPILESTEDLTTLSYLNEPAVLHAIRTRYAQLNIYTFSGIVLIATNPFDRVDNLYTPEIIQTYSGRQRGELEPHLFSIAEDAYRCMVRENRNQTIVVSGESGAGKTVSAKYIMRYFATVDDPEHPRKTLKDGSELSDVEREILATNPIMEAFGNAKTTRNDNSSRFGKYLEIRFSKSQEIVGARIRTYLLERSRIVGHAQKERNYHIFYQLVRGATPEERQQLGLEDVDAYSYLNQGDPNIAGIDDGVEFTATRNALNVVGIHNETQSAIFKVLAALLHLGNVNIKPSRSSVSVSPEDPALVQSCELLGIPPTDLARWLTKKQIVMRSEKIISDLDAKTALTVRDSVAKYIYSLLFDWLVAAVNRTLLSGAAASESQSFIGVLDIYGFEHFKKNSFEQFCINYANEKLQQEFNQHVFKLEQEEYAREEIDWNYIDFSDNQPCIALIENKLGILGLLDEESRLPAGSDDGFVQKLYSSFDKQAHFSKPRFGQSAFVVRHYAMEVTYETEGFIEKNRDTVPDQIIEMLNDTSNTFLKQVFDEAAAEQAKIEEQQQQQVAKAKPGPKGPAKPRKPTLGNIFKTSLIELMSTINSTNVHYIRCIKPNEEKEAWKFDGPMVLSQLRACGVLETIRISSAGFPSRWTYEDFAERYEMLLNSSQRSSNDPNAICQAIIDHAIKDTDKYQLGKTKIFFRAGMLAHLEKLRSARLADAATQIQSILRMRYYRRKYKETLESIAALQTIVRGYNARRKYQGLRRNAAATRIQSQYRGFRETKNYNATLESVNALQAAIRGYRIRRNLLQDRKDEIATDLQSLIRGYTVRSKHKADIRGIILAQTLTRRRFARRELERLREERTSVKHYEEVQYRLENKVVQLQQAISEHKEKSRNLAEELKSLHSKHETLLSTHQELENTRSTEMESHKKELDTQKAAYNTLQESLDAQAQATKDAEATVSDLKLQLSNREEEISGLNLRVKELEDEVIAAKNAAAEASASAAAGPRQMMMAGAGAAHHYDHGVSRDLVSEPNGNVIDKESDEFSINTEIEKMLNETPGAKEELLNKLIRNLSIPQPKATESINVKDVMFPSNMVNMMISEMWRLGYVAESEKLIGSILKLIQETVDKYRGDKIIPVGAFWMSNVQEIYSFLCLAEINILQNPILRNEMTAIELNQYERLMNLAKRDTEAVTFNIYHIWMKEIKKLVDKMIVPAVVDEQSIPGFHVEEQPRFLSKMFQSGPDYKMNDLLLLLTKVYTSMKAFHLEEVYVRQPILELLHMVGAKAFNDMIMRKNFLSWKRAVQINYNVTRIEEWCKGHGMPEGALPLDRLMQSAKLLQLKKNLDTDVNIIYDICWALSPTQIQRLIVNYHVSDYETPIPATVLDVVAQRVKEDKTSSTQLLLDVRPLNDSGPFEMASPRVLKKIEPYIPADLDVPKLRMLTEITAKASRLNETGGQEPLDTMHNDVYGVDVDGEDQEAQDLENIP